MLERPSAVALIPARAGSKRVQGKNVRPLEGHPMLAYTIAAAAASGVFGAIVVSTDSPETAAIARHYGAAVPFLRPAEFAGDLSPDIEWVRYTLARLAEDGQRFDCFSILRPTSPFRQPSTIQRAWQQFLATPAIDSLRAVTKCREHPGKMWVISGDRMTPLLLNPGGTPWHSTPYQALPEVYVQNASLEIAWARVVVEQGTISGTLITPFPTQGYEGFDINDELDWIEADILLKSGSITLPQVTAAPYDSAAAALPEGDTR